MHPGFEANTSLEGELAHVCIRNVRKKKADSFDGNPSGIIKIYTPAVTVFHLRQIPYSPAVPQGKQFIRGRANLLDVSKNKEEEEKIRKTPKEKGEKGKNFKKTGPGYVHVFSCSKLISVVSHVCLLLSKRYDAIKV